jgi:RHS repeat-associated protein
VEGSEVHHLLLDHLGVPTCAFDTSGGVAWSARVDIFGESHPTSGTFNTTLVPHRWPGQQEDQDSGLHYNRFRYYDPSLGEYISRDPIGIAGGLNAYGYVRDTTTWIDPFGLSGCEGLVPGEENFRHFPSFNEARAAARKFAGLDGPTVDFKSKLGPHKGRIMGRMTPDGQRGWRIDFDPEKGFHVNWWDHTGGPKREKWLYGANIVDGGTLDDFYALLQHFPPT